MDHVLRYQDTPGIKMIVVLGEVGIILQVLPVSSLVLVPDRFPLFNIRFALTHRSEEQRSTRSARASGKEG